MKSKLFIVISFFLFISLTAKKDIRVISSSQSSFTFEYTPNYFDIKKDNIGGEEYLSIPFDGANGYSNELIGKIFLKYRTIPLGVPSEFGNTIQILSTQHSIIKGKVAPIMGDTQPTLQEIRAAENSYEDQELVRFGEFGYSRDLPLQDILIAPVRYNSETDEITLYNKITVKINFGSTPKNRKEIKNDFLGKITPNFSVAKNWGREATPLSKTNFNENNIVRTWYKFQAPDEGIYKITRGELASLGIDASTVDPRTIKIFGNGGYALSEAIEDTTPYGMTENAIYIEGEEDGSFDENDYILFYGRGIEFWESNSSSKIKRYHNPFSKENYYWITFGEESGKRMENKESFSSTPQVIQTTTTAFKWLDEDKLNIGRSGRDYWGDEFTKNNRSHTYINTLTGRIDSEDIIYRYRLTNASESSNLLTISENGKSMKSQYLSGHGEYYWGRALTSSTQYSEELPENNSVLKFDFSGLSSDSKMYIDYYEIEYQRDLKIINDEIIFFTNDTNNIVQYKLNNFSNSSINIYDITENDNIKIISAPNINGGMVDFTIVEPVAIRSKYIALTNDKYKSISQIEKVEITNSIVTGEGAEYIIITDRKFETEAERLAEYRKNDAPQKYSTKIVYVQDILNEFSCGMMDPTAIRNFLKYGYENWQIKPFYVLLFGDGNYDYFDAEGYNQNYVPTYQTKESMSEIDSYPMDDYYARIIGSDRKADLAIGRLNIQTNSDAENVVDKIIFYETPDNGLWKNLITLVADDGLTSDGDDTTLHTYQSETLATTSVPGFIGINKIYLAAYPTVITGFGRRKPEVNKAIINAINQGTLILNYIGHGNPDLWAHENVFERTSSIPSLKNDKLFFLTAATCDYGRFDDPTVQSSTEELLLAENRGMIGGVSSARVVYSGANEDLNLEFYSHLLNESLEAMSNTTVGEAYYLTKVARTGTNDQKFHLFSDPAIRLNLPKTQASIEKVNGQNLTADLQLKALSEVSIDGIVKNYNGTDDLSFNGEAVITVYDSEIIKLLPELGKSNRARMVVPGGVIFRGRSTISNGKFSTKFTVPQDISYENKNGKITAYITNDENDGIGYTKNVIIGGTDSTATNDGNGPEIEVTFDDAESSNATLVNQDFTIILNLQDETGLNTTGTGIGHKLKGIVDDDLAQEIDFTNHFVGDLDAEGKSGQVNYKVTDFELGEHKIDITAWDVYNNPAKQITYFTVVNSDDVVLKDVVNYPNPFSDNTTFIFQHNIIEPIDVKIKIYTIAGRLIRNIEEYSISDNFVKINWDGRDEDGSNIANGTYLYKVIIKSIDGKSNQNVLGKLSIIH